MSDSDLKANFEKNWRIADWFPDLSELQQTMLRVYYLELLKFNPKINLISRRTETEADQVHFADSIMAGKLILFRNKSESIVEIGSGNGFPGLVMAVLAPERKFVLLDKDQRKVEFLKHVASRAGLKNVSFFNGLFEAFPEDSIDCAVSRGFASLSGSIISARKAFKVGGEYYHMKGSIWATEMAEIPTQVCSIWTPSLAADYRLPETSITLSLVLTKKIAK